MACADTKCVWSFTQEPSVWHMAPPHPPEVWRPGSMVCGVYGGAPGSQQFRMTADYMTASSTAISADLSCLCLYPNQPPSTGCASTAWRSSWLLPRHLAWWRPTQVRSVLQLVALHSRTTGRRSQAVQLSTHVRGKQQVPGVCLSVQQQHRHFKSHACQAVQPHPPPMHSHMRNLAILMSRCCCCPPSQVCAAA